MGLVGVLGIFPPSKLIYILAGYFAFEGHLSLTLVILIGGLGHAVGNQIQYEVGRKKGLDFLKKHHWFPAKEVKKAQIAFSKKGPWFLFVGKLVDPLKLFISLCAGVAKMKRSLFFVIVLVASFIWAGLFAGLGYYFGKSYENFGYLGVFLLLIGVLVISSFYKFMNSEEVMKEV